MEGVHTVLEYCFYSSFPSSFLSLVFHIIGVKYTEFTSIDSLVRDIILNSLQPHSWEGIKKHLNPFEQLVVLLCRSSVCLIEKRRVYCGHCSSWLRTTFEQRVLLCRSSLRLLDRESNNLRPLRWASPSKADTLLSQQPSIPKTTSNLYNYDYETKLRYEYKTR